MSKYRMKIILIVLSISAFMNQSIAQVTANDFSKMTDFMPPAPNANSLIQNSMASVNKNTGAANVSIPLYTIKGQKLTASISLSYNSTGIKIDEISGRTGMGWALQAGGVITRTLRGSPDESNTRVTEPATIGPNCDTWILMNRAESYSQSGGWDAQPDLFNFTMNGLSGSFVFNASMQVVPIDPQQYKIEPNFSGTSYSFKITDNSGIMYFFGGTNAKDSSRRASSCGKTYDNYLVNAWYLTKIEYPNGEKIDFTYTPHSYHYDNGVTETMTWGDSGYPECFPSAVAPCANFSETKGVLLSSVSNDYTQINFTYIDRADCNDKLVEEVRLYDKKDLVNPAAKYVLSYNTVTATGTSGYVSSLWGNVNTTKTPYLASLQELSKASEFSRTYTFDYINPNLRSRRLSFAQDHWGYYNGKNNLSFVPAPSDSATALKFPNASANKSADETKAIYGLLERINFPTGGKQEIVYEGNKFYDVATSTHRAAAGLKVIQINTQNPGEDASIRKYTYAEFETPTISSLYSSPLPEYLKTYEKRYLYTPTNGFMPNVYHYCENIGLYSSSLTSLYMFQNSPVSYSSVLESIGNDNEGGMIQNKFMVSSDFPGTPLYGDFMIGQPLTNGAAAFNGKLKEEVIYKKGSTNLFPIKKTVNTYQQESNLAQEVLGYVSNRKREHIDDFFQNCPTPVQDLVLDYHLSRYKVYSYWVHLQSTTETQYDENGLNPLTKTTSFTHSDPSHLQVTKIETTDGENRLVTTTLKYPKDFASGSNVYQEMVDANIITPVINYKQTKTSSLTPIVEVQTDYSQPTANNYVPAEIKKSSQGSAVVSEGTFNSYDSKGNVLQYTDKSGTVNAVIWGYGHLYPVAKITGTNYATVVATLTGGNVTALQTLDGEALKAELNKIRIALSGAFVITYTYKHLAGVTSITDPNNKTTTYLYDSFNRLVLVRDDDGNIVKRICYNYNGQAENCTIPSCDYKAPIWQNTATALRCEIVGCAYTGNQQQEQADINTCSDSYNGKRWVNIAYNPSSCTGTPVSLTYTTLFAGYTIRYTNTVTGVFYELNIPGSPFSGPLGCIPPGKYNIYVYRSTGTPINTTFTVGYTTISGTEATFNNISVNVANKDISIGMAD